MRHPPLPGVDTEIAETLSLVALIIVGIAGIMWLMLGAPI